VDRGSLCGEAHEDALLHPSFPRVIPHSREAAPRILEVGSEDGCFTEWLSHCWPKGRVEGLEVNGEFAQGTADWATWAGRTPRLTFRQGNVLEMTEREAYDLIFCFDVLGYIQAGSRGRPYGGGASAGRDAGPPSTEYYVPLF